MKVVYLDCIGGISGDMLLGALLDAGVPEIVVGNAIASFGVEAWDVAVEEVERGGVRAAKAVVTTEGSSSERPYSTIVAMVEGAELHDEVKQRALTAFRLLGEAEARIHGTGLDDLHLHEVGADDAIIDIVGSCAALVHVGADRIVCSPIPTGRGTTSGAHGKIPVPAPAVLEILRDAPLYQRGEHELVTPTGAALVSTWCDAYGDLPPVTLTNIGYGAGDAELDFPNLLRVIIGETLPESTAINDPVELLESNIDDMTPELMPYVLERLMMAGALDAWVTPIVMKKDRNALTLSVLCDPSRTGTCLEVIFKETTTLGVRLASIERATIAREHVEVDVGGQRVRVKIGRRDGEVTTVAPEYDDAVNAARTTGMALREVYDAARRAADTQLELF